MKPYSEEYRPQKLAEVQGQDKAVEAVKEYLETFKNRKKRGLLLHGPPGVGKTSIAVAAAGELGYELVEVNASDVRNAAAIKEKIAPAISQMSLFGKGKVILIDEVDGVSGVKDRGGVSEIAKLVKKSSFPILITANDAWSKKLSTLRKEAELVECSKLNYRTIKNVLQEACEKAGIKYDKEAITKLARRAGGDLRGALTDLQTLGKEINQETVEALSHRDQKESMFNAMQRILKGSDPQVAREAVDIVDEDIKEIMLWVDENLPKEYTKMPDLEAAYDKLSKADIFQGRIMRWQHWRFLVYVIDYMTSGVAIAKEEKYSGFTKYSRPQRLLKYWRANMQYGKRNSIAEKYAEVTHSSINITKTRVPQIRQLILGNENIQEAIAISSEELEWLKK